MDRSPSSWVQLLVAAARSRTKWAVGEDTFLSRRQGKADVFFQSDVADEKVLGQVRLFPVALELVHDEPVHRLIWQFVKVHERLSSGLARRQGQ